MRSAQRPQHPPRRGLKRGARSAVGGRPSVSLPNFLRWAPHPPRPTRPAAASLQAPGPTLGRPGRELQRGPLRSPTALTRAPQTAFPARPAPGPHTFPPHARGAAGRAAGRPRGWPPSPPLGAAQPRRRGHAGAHSPRERPGCHHGHWPSVGTCPRWGHLVFRRNEFETLGAVLIRFPTSSFHQELTEQSL